MNSPARLTSLGQIDGCFFTDTRIGPSDQHSFAIESLGRRPGLAEEISETLRNMCQATQGRRKKELNNKKKKTNKTAKLHTSKHTNSKSLILTEGVKGLGYITQKRYC